MVFVTPLLHSEGVGDPETFRLTYTGGLQTREKGQKDLADDHCYDGDVCFRETHVCVKLYVMFELL